MPELGKIAYEAFRSALADDNTLPTWNELDDSIRDAWSVAADAIWKAATN